MKILCIKDTIGFKQGEVYETATKYIAEYDCGPVIEWAKYPEYFTQTKEGKNIKSKYKVGDYLVQRYEKYRVFTQVTTLYVSNLGEVSYNGQDENYYTQPTEEELELYYP